MSPFRGPWGWMYWNLTLAAVPMVLALVLFRRRVRTGVLWWVGAALFVAFLPNAPYVLTDIQHYAFDVARFGRTESVVHYVVLFGVGMAAYVIAMWRCTRFMLARGLTVAGVVVVNALACALCSVGVYLGRVHRFNSWDVVRAPEAVAHATFHALSSRAALVGMAKVFAVLAIGALVGIVLLDAIAGVRRHRQSV
jgi:uncharacterized membrane protein